MEERDSVQERAQVVEAPVPADRRAHTHVAHEVELAPGAPGATCQRARTECCEHTPFPEIAHGRAGDAVPSRGDKVDDALADLGWYESPPDASWGHFKPRRLDAGEAQH